MAVPIYKLIFYKLRLETYLVSEQQRSDMTQRAEESLVRVGGRSLLRLNLWSNERFTNGWVEEYPDLEAVRAHNDHLREMLWPQYADLRTVLGVPGPWSEFVEQPPPLPPDAPRPFYRLWMGRSLPQGYDSSPEDWEQYNQVNALAQELGILTLLSMDSRPFSERWHTITVERIPSVEAAQKLSLRQEAVKWWKFTEGQAYLGDAYMGAWMEAERDLTP